MIPSQAFILHTKPEMDKMDTNIVAVIEDCLKHGFKP